MFNDRLFRIQIAGAILGALLLALTTAFIAELVYQPEPAGRQAFVIGPPEPDAAPAKPAKPDAAPKPKAAAEPAKADAAPKPKAAAEPAKADATPNPQTAAKPDDPEQVSALLAGADVKNGTKLAKKCAACHSFKKGGPNKVGPNLWNIVGAKQAAVAKYRYSAALKNMGKSWGYEELNQFLLKPKAYLKGTKMTFAGVRKAGDRADLIVYLRSLSDAPKPLP
jgi:cytochrome c